MRATGRFGARELRSGATWSSGPVNRPFQSSRARYSVARRLYVAVIGRDILRHRVLVYNGKEGGATLSRNGH